MVLAEIIDFYCDVQTAIFTSMDSVYIDSYSWLDIIAALMTLAIIIDFIVSFRSYEGKPPK